MELTGIPKEAFASCFQDLQKHWQQCIDCGGNYFEGDRKHLLWGWILYFLQTQSQNFTDNGCTKDQQKDGDKTIYKSAPLKLISRQIIPLSSPYKRSFTPNILQIMRNKRLISLSYLNLRQTIVLMLIPKCPIIHPFSATTAQLKVIPLLLPFALRINPGQIGS
jgi:hypothetical protein